MDTAFFAKIKQFLSTERLGAYSQHDNADELTTLARYLLNMALCESLYSPLQMAEIALRNEAHAIFADCYGAENWFTLAPLDPKGLKKVQEANNTLIAAKKNVTPGQMVAELSFGFWTSFFNKTHAQTGMAAILLGKGFKHTPKNMRRQHLQNAHWMSIRLLRNRVFHHERIIHWKDLTTQHANLIDAIGWISPELKELAEKLDRFKEIHGAGLAPWVDKIKAHWPKAT